MYCIKFSQHITKLLHTTCEILVEPSLKVEIEKKF